MNKYLKSIERRLNLPKEVRERVMNDLRSSIAARREAGQTDEAIMAELGTPKAVAAELNEQMKEYACRRSPWRWAALAVEVLGGLMLAYNGIMGLLAWLLTGMANEAQSVGIIGGADGPTAIFVTSEPSAQNIIIWLMLLLMGVLGFRYLSHMEPEKKEEQE